MWKTTAYSNCLITAVLGKLMHWRSVRIVRQDVEEPFPYPPHFLWTDGNLIYDFLPDVDISDLRCWFPYKGHIRVRTLQQYKIWHPERTDL